MAEDEKQPSTKSKPDRVVLRVPPDVKMIIQHAANISDCTVSQFVANSAYEAAKNVIEEHEIVVQATRHSIAFHEAILNPKAPSETRLAASLQREKTSDQ